MFIRLPTLSPHGDRTPHQPGSGALYASLLCGTTAALLAYSTPTEAQEASTDPTAGTTEADTSPTESAVDVVQIEGGLVQGVETDVSGVQLFKGITYSAPTSGENRWPAD